MGPMVTTNPFAGPLKLGWVTVAVVTLGAGVAKGRAPWPMFGRDPRHTGRADVVFAADATIRFQVPVGRFGFGGVVVSHDEARGEDVVYGASHDSEFGEAVFAVSASGEILWKTPIEESVGLDATPYLHEATGTLYVTAQDNALIALRASDGQVLWRKVYPTQTSHFVTSSPTPGQDDVLYVMTDPFLLGGVATLYAIRLDGEVSWTLDFGAYSTGEGAVAVLPDGDLVAVTGCPNPFGVSGRLVRLDPAGKTVFSHCHPDPFPFFGTPAVDDDGSIYVGSMAQAAGSEYLVAFDASGHIQWENREVSARASPAIGPDLVYVVSTDADLVGLDKGTGAVRFRHPVGEGVDRNRAPPVVDACGNVVAVSTGGKAAALTPGGDLLWEVEFQGQALGSPAVGSDGTVYVRAYGLYAISGDTPLPCLPALPEEAGADDTGQPPDTVEVADGAKETPPPDAGTPTDAPLAGDEVVSPADVPSDATPGEPLQDAPPAGDVARPPEVLPDPGPAPSGGAGGSGCAVTGRGNPLLTLAIPGILAVAWGWRGLARPRLGAAARRRATRA